MGSESNWKIVDLSPSFFGQALARSVIVVERGVESAPRTARWYRFDLT